MPSASHLKQHIITLEIRSIFYPLGYFKYHVLDLSLWEIPVIQSCLINRKIKIDHLKLILWDFCVPVVIDKQWSKSGFQCEKLVEDQNLVQQIVV